MKYEPPYGSPGSNDPYINGNPSTGTMGSIPPAASIEYPQREIVNFITGAGLTPTDTDLKQLLKAVRTSAVMYGVDFGTPGTLTVTFNPVLDAYTPGLELHIKVANPCPGPSTFHSSILAAVNIVKPDGSALTPYSWPPGAIITIIYDGTNFQLIAVSPAADKLSAPATFYVNQGIGSDTVYDGTAATISGKHGPFATIQRAITEAQKFNQNGYGVTVIVALGTYPPFTCSTINGSGGISIVGDTVTPSNVLIHAVTGEAIGVSADGYFLSGLKMQSDATGAVPHLGAGIRVSNGHSVGILNCEFGACASVHAVVETGSYLLFLGTDSGNPGSFINVSGDAPIHILASGAIANIARPTLNVTGARNIATWLQVGSGGTIMGIYQAQNLGGGVTGKKYDASLNGVVNSIGSGANYFPGSIAGTLSTGGQYG
jgi:hypothetical protein